MTISSMSDMTYAAKKHGAHAADVQSCTFHLPGVQ